MRTGLLLRAVVVVSGMCITGDASGTVVPRPDVTFVTVTMTQVPAREAVAHLARLSGLRVVPLWVDADHRDGLDPDRLVDLECRAATPLRALESLLHRMDPGSTWQSDETGAIEIGPRTRLNERRTVHVYDIRDLLNETPNYRGGAAIDLEAALHAGSGTMLKEDNSGNASRDEGERQDRAARLVELITSMIEPEQWVEAGGDSATVRVFQSTLVVNAPEYIHRQIAGTIEAKARVAGARPLITAQTPPAGSPSADRSARS